MTNQGQLPAEVIRQAELSGKLLNGSGPDLFVEFGAGNVDDFGRHENLH